MTLSFYFRHGCHLCDAMLAELASFQNKQGCQIDMIDVDSTPQLQDEYGLRVPVLAYKGQVLCEHFFDPECLEELTEL